MSLTYLYTGSETAYVVPAGIDHLKVQAWGGKGGHVFLGAHRGKGGYVEVTFAVNEGDTFQIYPGGEGLLSIPGNGLGRVDGGQGGSAPALGGIAGGGGGAGSYIAFNSFTSTDACALVVGGGGGAGTLLTSPGGDGGGNPGQDGDSAVLGEGGDGASGTSVGQGGSGIPIIGVDGDDGAAGNGGDGATLLNTGLVGGGGGGGGRRGGGGGALGVAGAGGGGGNGYTNPGLTVVGAIINVRDGQVGYVENAVDAGRIILTPLAAPCIAEGSLVRVASGRQVEIENLRPGQCLNGTVGQPIQVEKVVRFDLPSRQFVRIGAGSLGKNQPAQDLLIRPGHPILVRGKEVLPEQLIGNANVDWVKTEQPLHYYTLVTGGRTFVDIQGVMVATWSQAGWENAGENDSRFATPFSYLE